MSVAALTSCENELTTLIGYKMRDKAMMSMDTTVVHQVEVLLEIVVVVVWLEEEEARLCVTTVTRPGI